jgi:hypothetical protein
MRVIVLNKKRLGVTAIIIGLMLVRLGFERKFDDRLKTTALMYSDINSLTKYEGLDHTFSYKLPGEWRTSIKNLGSSEVIYHNDFNSKDDVVHGFVEVWNLREDLKSFLQRSMTSAYKPPKYKEYDMSPITIGNHEGYLISYNQDVGRGNYYKGHEYFFSKDGKMYRFSFFVREANYKESMSTVFQTIVKTLIVK